MLLQNNVLYPGGAGLLHKVFMLPPTTYPYYNAFNNWMWDEHNYNYNGQVVIGRKTNEPKIPASIPVRKKEKNKRGRNHIEFGRDELRHTLNYY